MSTDGQGAAVVVRNLTKEFELASGGTGVPSLMRMLSHKAVATRGRKVVALDDVGLSIGEGERVGVIGRNGAGKTTLLSIIAGVSSPSSGSIAITGDIHAVLTIGSVLRDELSGRENIRLDRAVHGLTGEEIDAKIDEIVAFSELGDFIDRPVRTYSSGMKARLAFSMGAFVSPDILIIDETLSVGDAFFAAKASARMREIAAEGRIVIMVSHGLASIVSMCTRCIWLDEGRIVMDGDPVLVTAAYEKAVSGADDADLAAKFAVDDKAGFGSHPDALESLRLEQDGEMLSAKARAFVPMTIVLKGSIPADVAADEIDLVLTLRRVDGRLITSRRLSDEGASLRGTRALHVRIGLVPMILGADLYRVEVAVQRGNDVVSRKSRVFEVIDEEGQYGGRPLLYQSPEVSVWPVETTP
ncbi:ABC transporter ATP-binding protein [uncultured Alsobacter sp.]|uniref:ABC transporter ATP-binding protein n=1 Tax=uncultured Alsobacter sp. TaxID=1748258 RepID=UPI0025D36CBC|nr:ABC transporter ATP-binding protein [uncultured Alsobacter sp.]